MFYKFEDNQLYSNGTVIGDLYALYSEDQGWYWFNDEQEALSALCEFPDTYNNGVLYIDI